METITPTIRPTPKQELAWEKLLDLVTKFLLFGGGAGGGKTWMYCEWLLTDAYRYPGSRGFMARNELKRLMNSTYVTWTKVCAHHNIPRDDWTLDGKYNVIRFKNGSTIDLLDVAYKPTDPDYDRFGSTEYSHGFGEEIQEWHFKAFDVLKSRIGRHKDYCRGIDITPPPKFGCSCNPSKGWPKRVFYDPYMAGTLPPQYAFIQSLYSDNHYTSEEYGKQLDEITDKTLKQRLKDGNWQYDEDAGTLMKYDNIRDLFTNNIVKDGQKSLIVDVARYGRDKTVFNHFDGLESTKRESFSEQGTDKTIQLIRDRAAEEKIPYSHILIDEDGVGGGVVDQLTGVKRFMGGSSPVPTRSALRRQMLPTPNLTIDGKRQLSSFQNLKTQCAFKLAELVETHRMAIKPGGDQDEITEEFSQIKQRDIDKDGKLKIVSNDSNTGLLLELWNLNRWQKHYGSQAACRWRFLGRYNYQVSITNIIMFTSIILGLAPFVLNAATEGAKWLTGFSSTAGKRFLLAVLAILGAVSFSAVNGTPLDVNSMTSLIQVALEALLAFFAAHGTYSLITTPSTGPNA